MTTEVRRAWWLRPYSSIVVGIADLGRSGIDTAARAVSLGFSRRGLRHVGSFGIQQTDSSSVFRVASLTKPFTAAAVVLAARDAGISLKTPIIDLLPALRTDWRADAGITVSDVLGQVSGLNSAVTAADVAELGSGDNVLLAASRLVGIAGSARPPGQAWEYYNGNYFLAGLVLSELMSTTYEQAMSRLILKPWGLKRSGFTPPRNLIQGYEQGDVVPSRSYPRGRQPSGGLCSCVSDLLTFGERLMADETIVDAVSRPRTKPADPLSYGLGWARGRSGQLYLNGRLPGYRAAILLYPRFEFVSCVLTNDTDALPAAASALSLLQEPLSGDDVARAIDEFAK